MTILFPHFTKRLLYGHQATFKWAISLVVADGANNLPQVFVWVCMGKHTHFITQFVGNVLRTSY